MPAMCWSMAANAMNDDNIDMLFLKIEGGSGSRLIGSFLGGNVKSPNCSVELEVAGDLVNRVPPACSFSVAFALSFPFSDGSQAGLSYPRLPFAQRLNPPLHSPPSVSALPKPSTALLTRTGKDW